MNHCRTQMPRGNARRVLSTGPQPQQLCRWKQVTPLHNALIDKIISAPLHILASMRAKTQWVLDRNDQG